MSPYIIPGLNRPEPKDIKTIVNVSCQYFDVRFSDLKERNRRRDMVTARHTCIYIIKQKLPNLTLKSIGEYFGGYDHTTVINAIKTITNFVYIGDAQTLNNIAAINSLLNKN